MSTASPNIIEKIDLPEPEFFQDIPEEFQIDVPNPQDKAAELKDLTERLLKAPRSEQDHIQRIVNVGNGGTFQSENSEDGLRPDDAPPLDEIIEQLPIEQALRNQTQLHVFELFRKDSSQMNIWHWQMLSRVYEYLQRHAHDHIDAFTGTTGTDTMDDAGAWLSYELHQLNKLLVLLGSQQSALAESSDAKDNWARVLQTILLGAADTRRISERIILCGSQAIRATRAVKVSDHQEAYTSVDGNPLIDFHGNTNYKDLKFAHFARTSSPGVPFNPPQAEFGAYADIPEISMRGMSADVFRGQLVEARAAVTPLMGSATAPDGHSGVVAEMHHERKVMALMPPFPNTKLEIGHYAAGSGLKRAEIPYLSGTSAGLRNKLHYVMGILDIEPEGDGPYGPVVTAQQQQLINMMMCLDLSGEFQRVAA